MLTLYQHVTDRQTDRQMDEQICCKLHTLSCYSTAEAMLMQGKSKDWKSNPWDWHTTMRVQGGQKIGEKIPSFPEP